ncbi:outer membrane protein assembly factor BamE [Limnohabitans sp. T6-5]|uniref:outer membrane protein assembly factor BamE n=1 Tax=Limnohabitans sp. T6-5 TaxID=1100724 RepID=UPI001E5DB199|nr:outer membrane protein assembly factor BamE [Limnohabitans sp. T6-5]
MTFRFTGAFLTSLLLGVGLAGCSGLSSGINQDTFKPYVAEVVQGNFVSKEQRQALRPGMSRAQVKDILGTPLVASVFHADRWDYVFSIKRQGVPSQNFRVTVFFKGDVLAQIDNDELPSESEFVGRLVSKRQVGKVPNLQASEEDLKKFPASKSASDTTRPTGAALPASYPPLEATPR